MKTLWIVVIAIAMTPALAFAQTERAYVSGIGGFAITPDTTSRDVSAEAGVRIAPHLSLFADVGRFHNLQPSDVQDNVDLTTLASADAGLSVIGTGRVPAVYSVGGARYQTAAVGRVVPYVVGAVGVARLKPSARFTYSSGTLPDGSTPGVGDDVTTQLESAFDFSLPMPTNAFMATIGGGVEIPLARHWAVDADYRFARINADIPLNVQGATFGIACRF
jgi:opacity protein-like surface antigen